jgi:hypothetical protein
VEKVLELIGKTRTFHNYRNDKLGPEYLKLSERTAVAFQMLGERQKGDFLLIPAQFGLRHRGRSVRRAREVFLGNEFGLGTFVVGIMLLTHPERLVQYDDLWIDCAGDEFNDPPTDVLFIRAPYFAFSDGRVEFGTGWFGSADGGCGSASAFVPQN